MIISNFTPWQGLIGGMLIGAAAVIWLWLYGRVTGISGILGGAVLGQTPPGERSWRWFYLAGMVTGGALYLWTSGFGLPGKHFTVDLQVGWPWMLIAGLLVGFGTRLGNGCTSGHGICGLSRLSVRSLVATCTFLLFGVAATFVFHHLLRLS